MLEVDLVVIYGGSCSDMHLYGLPSVGPNHPSTMVGAKMRLFREVTAPLADYAVGASPACRTRNDLPDLQSTA